jgi:hypothetical protein
MKLADDVDKFLGARLREVGIATNTKAVLPLMEAFFGYTAARSALFGANHSDVNYPNVREQADAALQRVHDEFVAIIEAVKRPVEPAVHGTADPATSTLVDTTVVNLTTSVPGFSVPVLAEHLQRVQDEKNQGPARA